MQLVRDDDVDAAAREEVVGRRDDRGCVLGRGEAVRERAHPHVTEVLVVLHLRVEHDGPADDRAAPFHHEAQVSLLALRDRGG